MLRRLIPVALLVAYSAFLVRFVVFKSAMMQIGPLRLRFAPQVGDPNFVPFKSIWDYLRGDYGLLMGTVHFAGNIVLFVPVGLLVPFIYRRIAWPAALAIAIGTGLAIESMEAGLQVGVFDVDDIMLNGLGVMIGYWTFGFLAKAMRRAKAP
jgi:glycopeptide antibiotics resistance protein